MLIVGLELRAAAASSVFSCQIRRDDSKIAGSWQSTTPDYVLLVSLGNLWGGKYRRALPRQSEPGISNQLSAAERWPLCDSLEVLHNKGLILSVTQQWSTVSWR